MEDKLLHITREIEKQVDATIEQIDSLDVNDLENIRKSRIRQLKEREQQKKRWLELGHGSYEQLPEEKAFFDTVKKSENVVVHFFTDSSQNSPIMDMHLKKLAPKHLEARFVKMNAEKCPFLAERLKIKTIPTLVLVKNATVIDKVVGFTQLGDRRDFPTETLEQRIAQSDVIEYEGDPAAPLRDGHSKKGERKIRDGAYNDDDDDGDLEELNRLDGGSGVALGDAADLTAEERAELGLDDEDEEGK